MAELEREIVAYDWAPRETEQLQRAITAGKIFDTTLRDGGQTPYQKQPSLEYKRAIVDANARMGIEFTDICLPVTGGHVFMEGVEVARYINEQYPQMMPAVLTRLTDIDVAATIRFFQDARVNEMRGMSILFQGSSDYRLYVQDWEVDRIADNMYKFSQILSQNGITVVCATEDTTRSRPEVLEKIFLAGKAGGAQGFCIADTAGKATPEEVGILTAWTKKLINDDNLFIQFHGHEDDGNGPANSLAALKNGARDIHVTRLGIGERAGNTALETLLNNYMTKGVFKYDTSTIVDDSQMVARAFAINIPHDLPLVGRNVYTTETGIHADAIVKAQRKGRDDIAGVVYSATHPRLVGRELTILIGPTSGKSNVESVLERMGVPYRDTLSALLEEAAKAKNQALDDDEIRDYIARVEGDKRFVQEVSQPFHNAQGFEADFTTEPQP